MTVELETWLKQATRRLSRDSAGQVRKEIQEHYESAREAAMSSGSPADEAGRLAVSALGSATTANRQYREVLLTSAEAKMLGDARWEGRAVCSRPWLKWLLLAIPVAGLFLGVICLLFGAIDVGRELLIGGTGISLLFAGLFLPVYTPSRGRIFRVVKWVVLVSMLGLAFGRDAREWSWLLISSLWPLIWIEWTRVSIRRKLPVAQWPKALYL